MFEEAHQKNAPANLALDLRAPFATRHDDRAFVRARIEGDVVGIEREALRKEHSDNVVGRRVRNREVDHLVSSAATRRVPGAFSISKSGPRKPCRLMSTS